MKGKNRFCIGIILFFCLVAVNCYAQSSNDAQRLVGTWVGEKGTITFNANGTHTETGEGYNFSGNWGIGGNRIIMVLEGGGAGIVGIVDFFLSPDGRVLIVYDVGRRGGAVAEVLKKR